MKTAVEYIIDELSSRFDIVRNNLPYMQDVVKKAKEIEKEQIEEAIKNGYAGCCGKKTTVKLKDNFWERGESWDERKSVNEIIVDRKEGQRQENRTNIEKLRTSPERRYMIDFVKWITENYEFKDIVIPYEVVDKWEESKT